MAAEYKNATTDWVNLAVAVPALATGNNTIQCKRGAMNIVKGGTEPTSANDGVIIQRGEGVNVEDTAIWGRSDSGIYIGYIEVS